MYIIPYYGRKNCFIIIKNGVEIEKRIMKQLL